MIIFVLQIQLSWLLFKSLNYCGKMPAFESERSDAVEWGVLLWMKARNYHNFNDATSTVAADVYLKVRSSLDEKKWHLRSTKISIINEISPHKCLLLHCLFEVKRPEDVFLRKLGANKSSRDKNKRRELKKLVQKD